ncbi:CP family cyanate transporter-like MFS transporter [Novosphingobium sp. ST904]|nr:CP family cyanate transporter-like MFS transporter [Novosphingobium sp. ST904]
MVFHHVGLTVNRPDKKKCADDLVAADLFSRIANHAARRHARFMPLSRMHEPGTAVPKRSLPVWFPLLALIVLGCNLRSPLTAIQPVLGELRASLGLGSVGAGLLTSIPVLCFGLLPPLMSPLIGRMGIDRSIRLVLIGVAAATVIRPYTGIIGMFGGTLVIGVCIAMGNIVSLMLIARDFRRNVNGVTGFYTVSLNLGAMLTLGFTAPIAAWGGWQIALAGWVWLTLLALASRWLIDRQGRLAEHVEPDASDASKSQAAPESAMPAMVVWLMIAAFAIHIFAYYGLTAWLPTFLKTAGGMSGTQAGVVASSFQILSLTGSLGIPVLARRVSLGRLLVLMGAVWTVTPLWIVAAPSQWMLWSPIGSIAHGGTFVLIFMMIMKFSRTLDENRRISTKVQSAGYCFAALGPVLIGWLQGWPEGWWLAFGLLAVLTLGLIPAGLAIDRYEQRRG